MTCSVDGCSKPVQAKGLCTTHYQRQRRNGTTDTVYRRTDVHFCTIEGCGRPVESLGLCLMHYSRRRRGSDVATVPGPVRGGTLEERIWRRTSPPDANGCRIWDGAVTGSSDLPIARQGHTTLSVRRVLWTDAHDEELGPRWVVMTCSTPRCVAPEHMRVTTVHEYNSKKSVTSR